MILSLIWLSHKLNSYLHNLDFMCHTKSIQNLATNIYRKKNSQHKRGNIFSFHQLLVFFHLLICHDSWHLCLNKKKDLGCDNLYWTHITSSDRQSIQPTIWVKKYIWRLPETGLLQFFFISLIFILNLFISCSCHSVFFVLIPFLYHWLICLCRALGMLY